MTSNTTTSGDFFDEAGREGAPSAKLSDKGDFIKGTIVDLFERPFIKFGEKDPQKNDDGSDQTQLVIILQTDETGWAKVAKVPVGADGSAKPASDDKGLRAVYVPKYTNIYGALGRAIKEAGGSRAEVGGAFGIVVQDLEDVGKGNPKKVFRAKYDVPVKGVEVEAGDDPLADVSNKPKQDTPAAADKVQDTPKADATPAATEVEEPPF